MAHYKQDPTTYFINRVNNTPTIGQQHIIDSMDSVQFTLIPYKRLYGITKAMETYAEWEFKNSIDAIKISYISSNLYGLFDSVRTFSANRNRLEHNNGNVIVLENPEDVLKEGSLRGLMPSDVYIFDATTSDLVIERDVLRFIQETNMYIGRTTTHRIGGYASDDSEELFLARTITKTYHGSRFVIVCDNVEFMTQALLDMGIDEDEISPVELDGEPITPKVLLPMIRKITPGLIAADMIGVQPMTAPTSQIYTLTYQSNKSLQFHSPNSIITASP